MHIQHVIKIKNNIIPLIKFISVENHHSFPSSTKTGKQNKKIKSEKGSLKSIIYCTKFIISEYLFTQNKRWRFFTQIEMQLISSKLRRILIRKTCLLCLREFFPIPSVIPHFPHVISMNGILLNNFLYLCIENHKRYE